MSRLALLLACGVALPQIPEQPYQISINVGLVVLHASVRDHNGVAATDLEEANFEVYEDGVRQRLRVFQKQELPVTAGLVIDHSGSMRRKLAEVVTAARAFVKFSKAEDQMFVVNFNEKAMLGLPARIPLSSDPDELARAIDSARPEGMTALYDAIYLARERLATGSRDKRVLIVFSDGRDNASRRSLEEVVELAGHSDALVYTIGVFDVDDPDANPGVLRRLARPTGGEAYFPKRIEDVVGVCEGIAKDIRSQYTLGYVSENPVRDGGYRRIRVVAKAAGLGKLDVRARAGYLAEGGETK